MARKTKAQMAAEYQAFADAKRAEQVAEYPQRLMRALEEATQKNNYELTVKDGLFLLCDRDSSYYDVALELTYQYNTHSQSDLETLEYYLAEKTQKRAEEERRYVVKQAALAKLSKEEKELLGL